MGLNLSEINVEAHTCDVSCFNPEYNEGAGCDYSATGVNVNSTFSYPANEDGSPNTGYIIGTCPTCAQVSTFPTQDPKNNMGYALGQAKTE